jgi:hypothetical protein
VWIGDKQIPIPSYRVSRQEFIYSPDSFGKDPIRISSAQRSMFVVYGFESLVRGYLVSIVFALVVACFLGLFFHSSSWFHYLYLLVCIIVFPLAAHDGCPLLSFTRFPFHHSFSVTFPSLDSCLRQSCHEEGRRHIPPGQESSPLIINAS